MDRHLLERLVGAAVLVVALVIIAPAILKGPADNPGMANPAAGEQANGVPAETRRTHTIRLDAEQNSPPVARQLPPPVTEPDAGQPVTSEPPSTAAKPGPPPDPTAKVSQPAPKTTAKPKTVTARAAPPPVEGWVVQLGSFSSQDNARQLADSVSKKGFPAFLVAVDRSGKKLYRVRVGPGESRPKAEELAARLNRAGFAGQVTQQ